VSGTNRSAHLIAYDIRDPRRLIRVHRYLKTVAVDLQYSVFAGLLSERQRQDVLRELEDRIDPRRDDVRLYPLPKGCQAFALGRRHLPEGVFLSEDRLMDLMQELRRVEGPSSRPASEFGE
jgi:CRISPR-associated protein Cas2